MDKILNLTIDESERILNFGKILSNPIRIDILKCLSKKSYIIQDLAFELNLPKSTVSINVSVLEDAKLIMTTYQKGKHGSSRVCFLVNEYAHIDFLGSNRKEAEEEYIKEIPVGSYDNFNILSPTCGLVSEIGFIGRDDSVLSFYHSDRFKAQLLWFRTGYVEYVFIKDFNYRKIKSISFSFEACAEAPGNREEFPSDITVWVNGVRIGKKTYAGDFGVRRGLLTPEWWGSENSQYGEYKTWTINDRETLVNGEWISSVSIKTLKLDENNVIRLKIGVEENSHNVGGINIFGEKFGDVAKNIVMNVKYIK